MEPMLNAEELEALRRYDTPTIANAIETFDVRPRTAGFASPAVRCIFPQFGTMIGYAVTARCRAAQPAAQPYSRHGWWDAVAAAPRTARRGDPRSRRASGRRVLG